MSARRTAERTMYYAQIRVAPYDGETIPSDTDFIEVQAVDLSPTGIAFLCELELRTPHVVLALGEGEKVVHVEARIANKCQGFFERKKQYRLGCEFVGRL